MKTTKQNFDAMMASERARHDEQMKEIFLSTLTLPKKPQKDGRYYVWIKNPAEKGGRKHIPARSIPELKEAVWNYVRTMPGTSAVDNHYLDDAFTEVIRAKETSVKTREQLASVHNTIKKYESTYKRYIRGTDLQRIPLQEIRVQHLDDFLHMNLRRYDMKKKALDGLREVLNAIFKRALRLEWTSENPLSRIVWEDYKKLLIPPVDVKKRVHTAEEEAKMRAWCHEQETLKPHLMTNWAFELQIIIGGRQAEVTSLKPSDIHDGWLYIHDEQIVDRVTKEIIFPGHAKSDRSTRDYPLTSELREFLGRFLPVREKYFPESEWLFPQHNKTGTITNGSLGKRYYQCCSDKGIVRIKGIRKGGHSFR